MDILVGVKKRDMDGLLDHIIVRIELGENDFVGFDSDFQDRMAENVKPLILAEIEATKEN